MRSALVPGWEQLRQDRARGWVFLAVDVVGWGGMIASEREGRRLRSSYRDWGWEHARLGVSGGERRERDWEYYETMSRFDRSGRFDQVPGNDRLDPETDLGTYNGLVWRLAREIYLPGGSAVEPDPSDALYERALEYYRNRAIEPEFAWDWKGDEGARRRFSSLIRESDNAFRMGTTFLGALLANRFVAIVDAHLLARLTPLSGQELHLNLIPPVNREGGWVLGFSLHSPSIPRR